MLDIKNLTKSFGNKVVLNNVSLSVARGQIAVLLGSSGVGKSTLLRILNGLDSYDNGTILLDGQILDTTKVNKTHTVGIVFQQFNLFEHVSVEENITLPLTVAQNKTKAHAERIAQDLLAQYGLSDKTRAYVNDLSGGQKQRLALARTLALKPTVVCLDEPTSALDPLLTAYVADTIQDLAKRGYIVLVASHDTSLLERLDCTSYLMKHGSIVEIVQSAEFKTDPNKFPLTKNFVSGKE